MLEWMAGLWNHGRVTSFMKNQYLGLLVCLILVASFIFAVPVESKRVPDGCVGCYVQYDQSISCQFVGIGDTFTSHINGGDFWFGCEAPVVP